MMRRVSLLCIIGAALLGLACRQADDAGKGANSKGANANASREEKSATPSDSWVTIKIKLELLAGDITSGFATDVTTTDGVVTLSGKVDNQQTREAFDEVVKKVEGVRSVNNQLQIVPEAKAGEVNAADDKIEAGIEASIEKDQALAGLSLTADSNAGVVTLDGSVDNREELLKYAQAVRAVPGVKSVITTPVTVRGDRKP
jgi:hyperosmotically inducible periplasmic protein